MTTNPLKLTPQAARLMGELCEELRPGWNRVATANALARLRTEDPITVLVATLLAVADPGMRTPAGIEFTDRPHWHAAQQAVDPQRASDDRQRHHRQQWRERHARELAARATLDQIRAIRQRAKGPRT